MTQGFVEPPLAGRDPAYHNRRRITVIAGEELWSHHYTVIHSKDQHKAKICLPNTPRKVREQLKN